MTETVLDLYIDSETTGSFNNFDIHLPMPVIVEDNEKAYIRLKDYQQLNSCYNISQDLANNQYSIKQTTRTYTRTPTGADTRYITDTNLFNTAGVDIYKPILVSTQDGVAHTETLIPNAGNFTLKLYDSTINTSGSVSQTTSRFTNIFSPTPSPPYLTTRFMSFSNTDYLVFYNTTNTTESRFVKGIDVVIENVSNPLFNEPNIINIYVKVWGSVDGINWYDLGNASTNLMTYGLGTWMTSTLRTASFNVSVLGSYQYHKVSFIPTGFASPAEMKAKIKFLKIDLVRYAGYDEVIAESTTTYNKTIEDGFYSLTNLNASLNYYLKEHISGNLTFTNFIQGKTFLTAQNKHILSWSDTEPNYYYTEEDKVDESYKVEVMFNPILRKMLGWDTDISLFRTDNNTTAPKFLNLINFKKILLSSSLQLTTKPYTFLNKDYVKTTGLGDIFATINKDIPPFSYINWTNPTDFKIEIDDKLITKINFKILNEYCQVMDNIPSCNFHLQIIKEAK